MGHGTQEIWTTLGQYLPHQLGPDREGKELCAPAASPQIHHPGLPRGRSIGPDGGRGRGTQGGLQLGDEIAALFPGNDVSLRGQLSIGALHRDGTDLQVLRKAPPRGEPAPGGQAAAEDVIPDAAAEVVIAGDGPPPVQIICEHGCPPIWPDKKERNWTFSSDQIRLKYRQRKNARTFFL